MLDKFFVIFTFFTVNFILDHRHQLIDSFQTEIYDCEDRRMSLDELKLNANRLDFNIRRKRPSPLIRT